MPAFSSLTLEHFESLSPLQAKVCEAWWALFDAEALLIDPATALQALSLDRAALSSRTKGGLLNSILDSARSLGIRNEAAALGLPPSMPLQSPAGPSSAAAPTFAGAEITRLRTALLSPPRRMVRAACNYSPSIHLPNGIAVAERDSLAIIACDPHDVLCLVRDRNGTIGQLPTYVIGIGSKVDPDDRQDWELALIEGSRVAPSPNRMELVQQLLIEPGVQAGLGASLNFNRKGAYEYNAWTEEKAQARRDRRKDGSDGSDDDGDADYVQSDHPSGSEPSSPTHGLPPSAASVASAANLHVRGKFADDLLYLPPILQKATDPGVTRACMASSRMYRHPLHLPKMESALRALTVCPLPPCLACTLQVCCMTMCGPFRVSIPCTKKAKLFCRPAVSQQRVGTT